MTTWRKVRKNPVVVEAWGPWDGFVPGIPDDARVQADITIPSGPRVLNVKMPKGVMRASPGDYIIRHADGRLEVCRPDVFAETYESAEVSERWKAGGRRCAVAT